MHARVRLCFAVPVVGFMAVVFAPRPALADNVTNIVRGLNDVLNPEDARRYEDRARGNNRPDEEHYWHDYWAGLQAQRHEREIERDEARRNEEQARRDPRSEEERYWRNYGAGLDRGGGRGSGERRRGD